VRITGKLALRVVALMGALMVAVLGATSCQQLLGEVDIIDTDLGSTFPPDGGLGIGPRPAACNLGTFQCTGSKREICTQLADGNIGWLTQEDCLSNALCVQGLEQELIGCVPPACNLDMGKCEGATPQRCLEDLTGFGGFGVECANAGQCSTLPADCPNGAPCCAEACTPGTIRCNASAMERCANDSESWEPVESCQSADLCQQGLDLCGGAAGGCVCAQPVCQPGERRCSPDDPTTLEVCNVGQTGWNFVDTCETADLCQLGLTKVELACESAACAVGQFACTNDGTLQRCRDNRTAFDNLTPCPGGAAFCDSVEGVCRETPCNVGDQRCNGAVIEECRLDRTGFQPTTQFPCATAALCAQPVGQLPFCIPPSCAVDQFTCQGGAQLQRCNEGRNGFTNVGGPCTDGAGQPRPDLCSADRRRCDFCVPNRRECTPDLGSSRTCNVQGSAFGPNTGCPLGCVAETGACRTCNIGEFSCNNGTLSRCNDGRSFNAVLGNVVCNGATRVSCAGNTVQNQPCGAAGCNAQRLQCNECSGTQRRCSGGGSFQTCTANGTFGAAASCGNGLGCEGAGLCRCAAGARQCNGANLLVCSADRSAFALSDTCDSAEACAAATGPTCPECTEGQCVNGQPFSCNGGQLVPAAACGAGLNCVGAGLCRCTPDTARCAAGNLQECNANGTAFVAAVNPCAGDTFRFCTGATLTQLDCQTGPLCNASSPAGCADCLVDGNCDPGEICTGTPLTCQPDPNAVPDPDPAPTP
jgi:hypothetical protein